MKIDRIRLSVFQLPGNTARFDLKEEGHGLHRRWQRFSNQPIPETVHVLHVDTDDGIEGICTVGDARYTSMRLEELDHLRALCIGTDPIARAHLDAKLRAAVRGLFTRPGWHGAFDNCLWDIAGKATGLPVYRLIGHARDRCPAYYNFGGATPEARIADAHQALDSGFSALKDHFSAAAAENIAAFHHVRQTLGPDPVLLHDAASCAYSFAEALKVGRHLEELDYGWFEEPLPDRDQTALKRLAEQLAIPLLSPETLMHDIDLSALWLRSGATDWLRANARHGTTAALSLAHMAAGHQARIEFNGPGGLFGLVHAHLVCAIENTSYYEYFPGGSRDEKGRQIGLLNPPLPKDGHIHPPEAPGWGAEWDWDLFRRQRTAEL